MSQPHRPAVATTQGNGIPAISPISARAAITAVIMLRIDFFPIRHAANATSATTAGRVPAKAAATHGSDWPAA